MLVNQLHHNRPVRLGHLAPALKTINLHLILWAMLLCLDQILMEQRHPRPHRLGQRLAELRQAFNSPHLLARLLQPQISLRTTQILLGQQKLGRNFRLGLVIKA